MGAFAQLSSRTDDAASGTVRAKAPTDSALRRQEKKEEQTRRRRQENELKKTEARIETLEEAIRQTEEEMSLPDNATDPHKLMDLTEKLTGLREELDGLYEKWESLTDPDP